MPAGESLIALTCSYLPVTYKCMWDCPCVTLCTTHLFLCWCICSSWCWPPLAAHQLLFVFVAIALLSTSIHLCLLGHDVNPKWLIKDKSGPPKQHPGCLVCMHYPWYLTDVKINIGCVRILRRGIRFLWRTDTMSYYTDAAIFYA